MGDRVRLGELLAIGGLVGFAALLIFGTWFDPVLRKDSQVGVFDAAGADHLGWFALLVCALLLLAGLSYLVRLATAPTTERIMLQVPVVYAAALFTLLVLLVRVLAFPPDLDIQTGIAGGDVEFDSRVATGGWLGLATVLLVVVGTWVAMADDRTRSRAAIAATESLLSGVTPRPAPIATSAPGADSAVVADDAVVTDPSRPAHGGSSA